MLNYLNSFSIDLIAPIFISRQNLLPTEKGESDMTRNDGVDLDRYIVLRRGYGDIIDIGYGWSRDDLLALSRAVSWLSGSVEYDVAWKDVERRAKVCHRRATVKPC